MSDAQSFNAKPIETRVIGYLLANHARTPDQLDEWIERLNVDHFSQGAFRDVFRRIRLLRDDGAEVDGTTIAWDMRASLSDADLITLWKAEQDSIFTAAMPGYFNLLEDARQRRIASTVLHKSAEALSSGDLAEIRDELAESFEEMDQGEVWSKSEASAVDGLEALRQNTDRGEYVVGLHYLDEKIGALRPGTMTVVMGHTGDGKTMFGLQLARNVIDQGGAVHFYSTEMDHADLMARLIGCQSGIGTRLIEPWATGDDDAITRDADVKAVCDAWAWWEERDEQLLTVYRAALTASDITRRSLLHAARGRKPALIVVDYLQRVAPEVDDRGAPRHQQVGTISSKLKDLAMRLHCPVVVLAQPNRAWISEGKAAPALENLGESSRIEKDADVVLSLSFVWKREKEDSAEPYQNKLFAVICKHRRGEVGAMWFDYRPECCRIGNLQTSLWPEMPKGRKT